MTDDVPDVVEGGRSAGGARRKAVTLTVLAAAAVVAAAVSPTVVTGLRTSGPDGASPALVPAATAAKPGGLVCPPSQSPPTKGGYQVAIRARITDIELDNGWNEQFHNWQSIASNITAEACGLLEVPSLAVTIEADGLAFNTSKASIFVKIGDFVLFKPGQIEVSLAPTGQSTTLITGVRPLDGPDAGQLDVNATTPIVAHVYNGPKTATKFDCPVSVASTLTTLRSTKVPEGRGPKGPIQPVLPGEPALPAWTVEGSPLTGGALVGSTARVAGNDFPLPFFPLTGACASQAGLFNPIFGGQREAGGPYDDPHSVHPPGTSWVSGTLQITEVDPAAIANGLPTTGPGT